MAFEFLCTSCGLVHRGMPAFGADAPLSYYAVPREERATRCALTADSCVIDRNSYFVRGCIEIPVKGEEDPFSWGVWVSLSEANYKEWLDFHSEEKRSHKGPYFGWLNASLKPYPKTMNLKTRVHLRNGGIRPLIELEPTDHPLAVEQREGISGTRLAELYALMMHGEDDEMAEAVPSMDRQGEQDDTTDWPFDQPRNCATVVSKSILDRSRPILHVSHDEDDHGWQFLDGVSEELEDLALVGLGHVLEIDPAIVELADLAAGFQATRAGFGEKWVIEQTPPSEDGD